MGVVAEMTTLRVVREVIRSTDGNLGGDGDDGLLMGLVASGELAWVLGGRRSLPISVAVAGTRGGSLFRALITDG